MSGNSIRFQFNGLTFRFPGQFNQEDATTLRAWWNMFKENQDPDVALQSDRTVHILQQWKKRDSVSLNIIDAWKIFHAKAMDPVLEFMSIDRSFSLVDEYVGIKWTHQVDQIIFVNGDLRYERPCYPTEPFHGVFNIKDLPIGCYDVEGWSTQFEIIDLDIVEPGGETKSFGLINQVPEEIIKRSWNMCRDLLVHRGYRQSEDHEVTSFVHRTQPKGISFCFDPFRTKHVVWRSSEFVETFGDVYWVPFESVNYEAVVLSVLVRDPIIGPFKTIDTHGRVLELQMHITYAPIQVPHALFIGTWKYPDDFNGILQEYCEREKQIDIPFRPASRAMMKGFHHAYRLCLLARGYRIANEEEIQTAKDLADGHEYVAILDAVRPLGDSLIWQSECVSNIFGEWPPTEVTFTDLYNFVKQQDGITYRCQTIAGEIVTVVAHFKSMNNNSIKLFIVYSEWQNQSAFDIAL